MKKTISMILALALLLCLFSACGEKPVEETPAPAATGSDIEESVTGVGKYYFFESCIEAFSKYEILYTVELREDGSYVIDTLNSLTGETAVYSGDSYEWNDSYFTTGPVSSGEMPAASWFNPDGSCLWVVMGEDVLPMNYMPPQDVRVTEYKDILYACDSDAQVLDIYLPEAEGTYPVIVVCHGGGFKFGDQAMSIIKPIFSAATERGYAVVSVDYRKSMEAPFPAALNDVKAAVRWVRANAEQLGFDAENIAIWGESAGAYLALMTALTPDVAELNGDVVLNGDTTGSSLELSSAVDALVSFYAPVDFWELDADAAECGMEPSFGAESSFESDFVGQAVGADEEFTRKTWWGSYTDSLPADFALSAWVQVGNADHRVPYLQSVNFASELAAVIGEENVSFGIIEGADHEDSAFYTEENLTAVFDFLDGVLK